MYAGPQEWQRPDATAELADASSGAGSGHADLYRRLMQPSLDDATRAAAGEYLAQQLERVRGEPGELPAHPGELQAWMESNTQSVHARYAAYLAQRKEGQPRRFFANRAHALHVLRQVAPTKLVDGAWLYGLVKHAANPKMSDLVRTYVEELGEGDAGKNHVVLYRDLLNRYNLDPLDDLDDTLYTQGAIQLALGACAEEFLPEVIGFNLSYEQLPLHLLITAHELNELGIDPYYFTLHVTVDNGDTGHARRACQAVLDMLPRLADDGVFWERVRAGAKLADVAPGTMDAVEGFRIDDEVLRIFARKSVTGHGAHSDYCRVAGKSVNEWLARPAEIPQFLAALEAAGWIQRGKPVDDSRFWGLLQGPRAEMFGVFSSYELQVIHDWIRGDASADGAAFTQGPAPEGRTRRASFRAMQRARPALVAGPAADLLDPDLDALKSRLATADPAQREQLLCEMMSPAMHWTPAGLEATRQFWSARSS
ncbi:iron-containing redox enzyme family protein [Caenimonas aquaedulcis]|uniref:Iron-containing redox enzyme family protein n=1 Tax=Caenimonas aquaedulcis TaxID=2793270 RepID=A0A931H846_9BURK|nr:iron-containing redox enzyme family protein [Caenimonas aquaedulcis]MBG9390177.1 iron-containing redox enzyme family protein [Caenimonas aquaedulcis]